MQKLHVHANRVVQAMSYFHQWENMPVNTSRWQDKWNEKERIPRRVFAQDISAKCRTVLNVGCGIAKNRDFYTAEYYGVDVTPKFVKEAHRQGADVQVASILNLPFKDKSFDCVCCENVLIHMPPGLWMQALDEMFRVARIMVATNEPSWKDETEYVVKEVYNTTKGLFTFWLNDYGKRDMLNYLKGKNVAHYQLYWDELHYWQITLMMLA